MKKNTFAILFSLLLLLTSNLFAQDDVDKRPVRAPFSSGNLINTQTIVGLSKNTLEFNIQHRFGDVSNGYSDFFGIFGSSNIRLTLRYGITKNISLGFGLTKDNFLHDFNAKYTILQQTRSGSIPVSLTYFGDFAIDSRSAITYDKFAYRASVFNQLIVGRKISRLLSFELAFNHAHFNLVDSAVYEGIKHDNFSVTASAKFRIQGAMSLVAQYDQPFTAVSSIKPNIGFGIDIATATHTFEVFVSNYHALSGQYNMVYNLNDFSKGEFFMGFNIAKRWSFGQ